MMDSQLFQLVNQRSDRQDDTLDEIKKLLTEHIQKDEIYWRKIDIQEAQLSMLRKTILGMIATMTTIISAFWAWVER
jgi:ABC-type transport system involved in cytochrome bd biosynthesis fused ATPase/permease subunit